MATQLSGQDIYDRIRVRLGALANVFTVDEVLSFAEDGVQEVWAVLKSFDQEYFGEASQDTDSTATDTYFADLSTTVREYALPLGCREIRSIECLTIGFESVVFEYKKFDDPLFQTARRDATASGTGSSSNSGSSLGNYYYTVFGSKFILAQYPEAALNVKLWFIYNINAITTDTVLSDILYPFSGKIVDYAVQKAMASTRDVEMTEEWLKQWSLSVRTLAMSTSPRTSTGPVFVADYLGT